MVVCMSVCTTLLWSAHSRLRLRSYRAIPWKEYSKADRRWGVSDPTILSVELYVYSLALSLARSSLDRRSLIDQRITG
jgi:hypothetical protein